QLLIQGITRLPTRGANIIRALHGQRATVKDEGSGDVSFIPLVLAAAGTATVRPFIAAVVRRNLFGQALQFGLPCTLVRLLLQPKHPPPPSPPLKRRKRYLPTPNARLLSAPHRLLSLCPLFSCLPYLSSFVPANTLICTRQSLEFDKFSPFGYP